LLLSDFEEFFAKFTVCKVVRTALIPIGLAAPAVAMETLR